MKHYITMRVCADGVDIIGSVSTPGIEGAIMVVDFSHEVLTPRDSATGLLTGKRQHKPIKIKKEIDRSSPLLMKALVNNAPINDVELRFWSKSEQKKKYVHYYTIRLANAFISAIQGEMVQEDALPEAEAMFLESVSFHYQKITWIYEDGAIEAEDYWGPSEV